MGKIASSFELGSKLLLGVFIMYAIFKSGGKQHRVSEGTTLKLEKLFDGKSSNPAEIGSSIEFNEVLMVADGDKAKVGNPLISGALIQATVVAQARHAKIRIVKRRRRKHYEKQTGHRQYYTAVKIEKIIAA
jgi:large subunit ribosomal protein L21